LLATPARSYVIVAGRVVGLALVAAVVVVSLRVEVRTLLTIEF
jgi:hypothetical protein